MAMKRIAWVVMACVTLAASHVFAADSEKGAAAPQACRGDASFFLAYLSKKKDSTPASFPNDTLYRFISQVPYIYSSELLDASVVKSERDYSVKITLAPAAAERFNTLANANAKAQDRHDFDELVALALVIDGRPRDVFQGMFHPISGNVVYWSIAPSLTQSEAEEIAAAINCKN
jgi:hypothetical protein